MKNSMAGEHKITLDKEYVQWRAQTEWARKNYEKTRDGGGVYNWWIHFNDFHWARTDDMRGFRS